RHQGAVALVAIGCGADANPRLRGTLDHCRQQGQELADEVERLLQAGLKPVRGPLVCKLETIELPLEAPPSIEQWRQRAERTDAQGRHAQHFLKMAESGQAIPASVPYRVGAWTF